MSPIQLLSNYVSHNCVKLAALSIEFRISVSNMSVTESYILGFNLLKISNNKMFPTF